MYTIPLEFRYWDARLYQDKNGDLRNKITRGWGKNQQKGEIATYKQTNGYLYVGENIDGKWVQIRAHRLVWLLNTGKDPSEMEIDHLDRNKSNNKIENLNLVTRGEHRKRGPKQKNCTSGVTGVSWYTNYKKWEAYIKIDGKRKGLGYFENKNDAIKARKDAEIKYGFHPIHGKTDEEAREILAELEAKKAEGEKNE